MPELTTDVLPQYYHLPICDAAKELGVCETLLKKFCRTNGISRWPHRKIKSIQNIVQQLQYQISQSKDKGEISRFNQEIEDYEKKKEMLISDPNLDFSLLVPKSVLQSFSKVKLKNEKRKINFDFDFHLEKKIEEKLLKENCKDKFENQSKPVDTIDSTITPKISNVEKKKPLKKKPLSPSVSHTSSSTYFSSPEKGISPVSSSNNPNNNNNKNNKNNVINNKDHELELPSNKIKKPQIALPMKLSFDLSPLSSFSLTDNIISSSSSNNNNNINNNDKNIECKIEKIDPQIEKKIEIENDIKDKEVKKEEEKRSIEKYRFLEIPMTSELKRNASFSAKNDSILTKRNFDEFNEEEEDRQRESEFQRFKRSIPALKYQRIFSDSIPLYYIH